MSKSDKRFSCDYLATVLEASTACQSKDFCYRGLCYVSCDDLGGKAYKLLCFNNSGCRVKKGDYVRIRYFKTPVDIINFGCSAEIYRLAVVQKTMTY